MENFVKYFALIFCSTLLLFLFISGNFPNAILSLWQNEYTAACLRASALQTLLGDLCYGIFGLTFYMGITDRWEINLGHILFLMFAPLAIGSVLFVGWAQY